MWQTHREFQEFVTLVERKYAFWFAVGRVARTRYFLRHVGAGNEHSGRCATAVGVRDRLGPGVCHEMEYFAAQWKLWPRIARYELTAIAEMPDRDRASLVWVLIDEKCAELTRTCLAEASISEVDVIGIEE